MIVGLGNPGVDYEATRHNIGFLALDAFREQKKFGTLSARGEAIYYSGTWNDEEVLLVKPQTFMNRSGRAVVQLLKESGDLKEFGLLDENAHGDSARRLPCGEALALDGDEPTPADLRDRVLVVLDDLDLPCGKLRFRGRGSAGGHRGLASVIEKLGTDRVSRLRIGVGAEPNGGSGNADAADYVLEPLVGEQEERLLAVASHAAGTLSTWMEQGLAMCANRFNGKDGELPEGIH